MLNKLSYGGVNVVKACITVLQKCEAPEVMQDQMNQKHDLLLLSLIILI